ncbi:hypothetical protein FA13DRAFT_1780493 [Coprinellus micaceus]|uniref:Uncharacterized protein n=1 Tax=Coprinellus micaceus TaxID=71717 RepID=A0A4Y7SDF6_COPMI|nr:hypothetical protein FA13DRAFT_1780493 [Coprinellus micaceus]
MDVKVYLVSSDEEQSAPINREMARHSQSMGRSGVLERPVARRLNHLRLASPSASIRGSTQGGNEGVSGLEMGTSWHLVESRKWKVSRERGGRGEFLSRSAGVEERTRAGDDGLAPGKGADDCDSLVADMGKGEGQAAAEDVGLGELTHSLILYSPPALTSVWRRGRRERKC